MILDHVFAKVTSVVNDLGYPVTVQGGSHWLADDPLVLAHPGLFTADCRYGLAWSGDPPECLSIPPDEDATDGLPRGPGESGGSLSRFADDESGAAMTSRVRSRSQAARAQASR